LRPDKRGRKSRTHNYVKKTKALRVNTSKTEQFMLRGESIEDVDSFVYLGGKVTKDGGVA
jgi:hypothetical protein